MTFQELSNASPLRAIFRNRQPDPGECVVRGIDWESNRVDITNGVHSFLPPMDDLHIYRDPKDPLELLRPLVEPGDENSTDLCELTKKLYGRACTRSVREMILNSGAWDYCKQAALDDHDRIQRWLPIHEDAYFYQRDAVPPHYQRGGLMMVGETHSGNKHLTTYFTGGKFWCCLLPQWVVASQELVDAIPFATDMPMMGLPRS